MLKFIYKFYNLSPLFISFYLLLFFSKTGFSLDSHPLLKNSIRKAKVQGRLGETSSLYLFEEGFYFHPLYNDITGGTDKHLTGSIKAGYIGHYEDFFQFEILSAARLITPAFRTTNTSPTLDVPIGQYADWWELSSAINFPIENICTKCDLQLTPSVNHVGDKGGKLVQKQIHLFVGSDVTAFEPQSNRTDFGFFLSYSVSFKKELQKYPQSWGDIHHQISSSYRPSKVLSELELGYNILINVFKSSQTFASEIRFISQINSHLFSNIEKNRYELAFGVRNESGFTPTIKYLSPFLKGDQVGQIYIDLIHLNFDL